MAWSLNRTGIVSLLAEMGELELAGSYLEFYAAGWRLFNSRYQDFDAGRAAASAGVGAVTRAAEVAGQWRTGREQADG